MKKTDIKQFFRNKTVRIVLVCLAALLLLIAVWKVFFNDSGAESSAVNGYLPTEREARISVLLSRIEGVDGATVMIAEEGGVPVSAVIVFEGADGFLTRMRVIEATANALSILPEKVLVYPA